MTHTNYIVCISSKTEHTPSMLSPYEIAGFTYPRYVETVISYGLNILGVCSVGGNFGLLHRLFVLIRLKCFFTVKC